MDEALKLVEQAVVEASKGQAENEPRKRIAFEGGLFNYMAAALPAQHAVGLKSYVSTRAGTRFVVLLFDTTSGQLLSVLEADWLGRIRTGAASGVATRALARDDARVAGVIGAGGQAETQIQAIDAVRRLETIKVFSRAQERREGLVQRLQPGVGAKLEAVDSAEEAVRGSQIVTTITTAREAVFNGDWLEEGTHVNAAGGNRPDRRELGSLTISRAAFVAVDSLEGARIECGDLILAARDKPGVWSHVVELGSILAGQNAGRTGDNQITVFESMGIALEDVAVARYIYDRAREQGLGQTVQFGGGD